MPATLTFAAMAATGRVDDAAGRVAAGDFEDAVEESSRDAGEALTLEPVGAGPLVLRSVLKLTELCWFDTDALDPARVYLLKLGTQLVKAKIAAVDTRIDVETHPRTSVPGPGLDLDPEPEIDREAEAVVTRAKVRDRARHPDHDPPANEGRGRTGFAAHAGRAEHVGHATHAPFTSRAPHERRRIRRRLRSGDRRRAPSPCRDP